MSKKPVAPPKNNILTWVIPVMALAGSLAAKPRAAPAI